MSGRQHRDGAVVSAQVGLALMTQALSGGPAMADPTDLEAPIVTAANNVGWRHRPQIRAVEASAQPATVVAMSTAAQEVMQDTSQMASSAATLATAPQEVGARAAGQPAVLTPIQGPLLIEGRYVGDISGEVAVDGRGTIDANRLIALLDGVLRPDLLEALKDRIGGRDRVGFDELEGEELEVTFDSFALAFNVRLGAQSRAERRIDFGRGEDVDPARFDAPARFSAMANVSVGQAYDHQNDDLRGLRAAGDVLINHGGFGGLTLSTGFDYDEEAGDEKLRRREIRLTKDLFDRAIRLTAGEFSPPISGFQGSERVLGISAGRAYSIIRPFQNIRPSGRREFVLDRPSFVEVEVNGVVVERLQLDPGPYSLSDFPFAQGANTIRVLVDDAAGRREIAEFDLYGGSSLLDLGVVDFGVSAGVLQEGAEFEYGGAPAFSGYVRKGVADTVSLGAGAQWVEDRALVETSATWGSPLGLIDLGLAVSHNGATGESGHAVSIDYLNEVSFRERDDTRLIVTGQAFSRDFQNAFERFAANPEAWRIAAQLSTRLDRYTINVGAAYVKGWDTQPDEASVDLSLGRSFGRYGVSLTLGHRQVEGRDDDTRMGVALTLALGRRWNAQARYESDQDFREVVLRRSSNGELGDLSGGLRLSRDSGRESLGGDLRYINNRFDAEVISNRLSSRTPGGATTQESLWRVASLFALADGVFAVGRPAREGFVIARLHDTLKTSRLALTDGNGRQIARDGWFGPAVAPIDRAYSVQRFEVEVNPLPGGYDLGDGLIDVFPGYGSGYAMTIGSDASRTALGLLLDAEGAPLALVSGMIEAADERGATAPKPFFTNRAGRFVGDGLAPGSYRLRVQGQVVGTFVIPEDSEGVVDVGRVQPTGQ